MWGDMMTDTKGIQAILKGYNDKKGELQMLEIEIREAEEIAGLRAVNYDKEPISKTYAFNSSTENEALNIYLLKQRKIHLESLIQRIDTALNQLAEDEREILKLRYIEGRNWTNIYFKLREMNLGMSRPTMFRKHYEAIKKFENKLFPNT